MGCSCSGGSDSQSADRHRHGARRPSRVSGTISVTDHSTGDSVDMHAATHFDELHNPFDERSRGGTRVRGTGKQLRQARDDPEMGEDSLNDSYGGSSGYDSNASFKSSSARLSGNAVVPHLKKKKNRNKQNSMGRSNNSGRSADSGDDDDEDGRSTPSSHSQTSLFNFGDFHVAQVDELLDGADITKPYPTRKQSAATGAMATSSNSLSLTSAVKPGSKGAFSTSNTSYSLGKSDHSRQPIHRKQFDELLIDGTDFGGAVGGEGAPLTFGGEDGDTEDEDHSSRKSTPRGRRGINLLSPETEGSTASLGATTAQEDLDAEVERILSLPPVLQPRPKTGWKSVDVSRCQGSASTKIRSIAMAFDLMLFAPADDSSVTVFNRKLGGEVGRLSASHHIVTCVAASADGRLLGTGCRDGSLTVWDTTTLKKLWTIRHEYSVSHFSFSEDATFLVSSAHDRQSHLWAMKDCRRYRIFGYHHSGPVQKAFISPRNQFVLTCSSDKKIMLQTLLAPKPFLTFSKHSLAIVAVDIVLKSRAIPDWTPTCEDQLSRSKRFMTDADPQYECLVVSCDFKNLFIWSTDPTGTLLYHMKMNEFAPHAAPYLRMQRTNAPQPTNSGGLFSHFSTTDTQSLASEQSTTMSSMSRDRSGLGRGSLAPPNINWAGCCLILSKEGTEDEPTVAGRGGDGLANSNSLNAASLAAEQKSTVSGQSSCGLDSKRQVISLVVAVFTTSKFVGLINFSGSKYAFSRPALQNLPSSLHEGSVNLMDGISGDLKPTNSSSGKVETDGTGSSTAGLVQIPNSPFATLQNAYPALGGQVPLVSPSPPSPRPSSNGPETTSLATGGLLSGRGALVDPPQTAMWSPGDQGATAGREAPPPIQTSSLAGNILLARPNALPPLGSQAASNATGAQPSLTTNPSGTSVLGAFQPQGSAAPTVSENAAELTYSNSSGRRPSDATASTQGTVDGTQTIGGAENNSLPPPQEITMEDVFPIVLKSNAACLQAKDNEFVVGDSYGNVTSVTVDLVPNVSTTAKPTTTKKSQTKDGKGSSISSLTPKNTGLGGGSPKRSTSSSGSSSSSSGHSGDAGEHIAVVLGGTSSSSESHSSSGS